MNICSLNRMNLVKMSTVLDIETQSLIIVWCRIGTALDNELLKKGSNTRCFRGV